MPRLFAAIDLPHSMAEKILALQDDLHGAQWEDQPHITLAHFGEVPKENEAYVQELLLPISFTAFELVPTQIGFFGNADAPTVMWIGIDPSVRLHALYTQLLSIRSQFAPPPDWKTFTPHITLARVKDVEAVDLVRYTEQLDLSLIGPFTVNEYHLYESGNSGYSLRRTLTATPE